MSSPRSASADASVFNTDERIGRHRGGGKLLAKAIMQISADAPAFAFRDFQHFALEPQLLRLALAQSRSHRGECCGDFTHFVAPRGKHGSIRSPLA